MANKIGRLVARVGSWTNNQGETKSRYTTMGTVFEGEGGKLSIKIDAMPVGTVQKERDGTITDGWDGWCQIFLDDDDQQKPAGNRSNSSSGRPYPQSQGRPNPTPNREAPPAKDLDDDIPFS